MEIDNALKRQFMSTQGFMAT